MLDKWSALFKIVDSSINFTSHNMILHTALLQDSYVIEVLIESYL